MSCSCSSSVAMIIPAVFTVLCSRLQSWAVRLPNHTVIQPVRALSVVQLKFPTVLVFIPNFWKRPRKVSLCCAYLKLQSVLVDHVKVSEMCLLRDLKLSAILTDDLLMEGVWFCLIILRLTMIPFVLLTFGERLLLWHYMVRSATFLLQVLSSLSSWLKPGGFVVSCVLSLEVIVQQSIGKFFIPTWPSWSRCLLLFVLVCFTTYWHIEHLS